MENIRHRPRDHSAAEEDGRDELRFFGRDYDEDDKLYFSAVISREKMRQPMADIRLSKDLPEIDVNAKALLQVVR
ncbi:hypothetical protein ELI48_02235 [Rhizobium ruizarguesonis]|uniref:hypothetical protein n=1 Tax=Rhizobium ruizarguesonis TaxID=2081791 RepID=UPI0010324192|nr:hypothetical protein [Rhizobium ruizarguesonis]TAU25102.1 hypothetical protein ELI48_02235 [Rhizobium ruizarguesonis]TAW08498.1 hypothetical protein ELI26_02225 [Rhizobium ruizarguesonis]